MEAQTLAILCLSAILIGVVLALILVAVMQSGPSILSGFSGDIEDVVAEGGHLKEGSLGRRG
jgi:hypothetical protein